MVRVIIFLLATVFALLHLAFSCLRRGTTKVLYSQVVRPFIRLSSRSCHHNNTYQLKLTVPILIPVVESLGQV